jgi:hypothetical protein
MPQRTWEPTTFSSWPLTKRFLWVFGAVAFSLPGLSQNVSWSGQAQCQVNVQIAGYAHQEIQTWTITGPPSPDDVYPATWSVVSKGMTQRAVGPQNLAAQWTSNVAPMNAPLRIVVRASDNRLLIKTWHAQMVSRGSIQGARQPAAGGLAPAQSMIASDAYEWQFPEVEESPTATNVSGTGKIAIAGTYLPQSPAGSSGVATCEWQFTKGSGGISPAAPLDHSLQPSTPVAGQPGSIATSTMTETPLGRAPLSIVPAIKQISQPGVTQGNQKISVTVTGNNTHFVQGTTTADFGSGITVSSPVTVNSPTSLTAQVNADLAATTGPHDVKVTTASEVATLPQSFNVAPALTETSLGTVPITMPAIAQVSPNSGVQAGNYVTVTLTGNNHTHFSSSTKADFGSGITPSALTNVSNNSVRTVLTIAPGAATGPRTVTLTTGNEVAKLANAFTVLAPANSTPASFQASLHGLSVSGTSEVQWCDPSGCTPWATGGYTAEMDGTFQPGDELHVVLENTDATLSNYPRSCDDAGENCSWAANFNGSAGWMPSPAGTPTPTNPIPAWIYVKRGNQHSNLIRVTYGPPLQTIQQPPSFFNLANTNTTAGFGADLSYEQGPAAWGGGEEVEHTGGLLGGGKGDDVWFDDNLNPGWYVVAVSITCNWGSYCKDDGYGLGGAAMLASPLIVGSTNPRIVVHWWVNAGGYSVYDMHSLTLTGPQGTTPFQINGH